MFQMLSSHSEIDLQNELYEFYPYIRGSSLLSECEMTAYIASSLDVPGAKIRRRKNENAFALLESAFAVRRQSTSKPIWGLKDPHLTYALREFIEHYPNAKFLFMIRDPRAVVNSYVTRKFNIANCYHGSLLWKKEVELQRNFREAHTKNCHLVRYEDLITNKTDVLRRVCDFLDITFEDALINYFKGNANTRIHAGTENITKDVDSSIQAKWKHSLSGKQIQTIEAITSAEARKNGYQIKPCDWECSKLLRYVLNVHQWASTTWIWQRHKLAKIIKKA